MISPYKRATVAIISTTLLHASIFYTLNEIEEPQIITPKTTEIALFDMPKIEEKKEEPKPKDKPKEEPKKALKQEVVKPKPMVKKESVAEVKPQEEPKQEELPQEAPTNHLVVAQNESLHISKSQNEEISQKALQEQKATSHTAPNVLETYLFKVREKIQENLRYPPLAKRLKLEGESVVGFEILDNGGVMESSCEIKNSSGHKTLDRQAIETILSILPFEAPPNGKISIVVPVAFNLR